MRSLTQEVESFAITPSSIQTIGRLNPAPKKPTILAASTTSAAETKVKHEVSASASIDISANEDVFGHRITKPLPPKVEASWQEVYERFTRQSLNNFSRGDNRGIFLVHSLECIMGAIEVFFCVLEQKPPG